MGERSVIAYVVELIEDADRALDDPPRDLANFALGLQCLHILSNATLQRIVSIPRDNPLLQQVCELLHAVSVQTVARRRRLRSEEQKSELQSLMRSSFAVFSQKNKT